jgi:hypothetical protein
MLDLALPLSAQHADMIGFDAESMVDRGMPLSAHPLDDDWDDLDELEDLLGEDDEDFGDEDFGDEYDDYGEDYEDLADELGFDEYDDYGEEGDDPDLMALDDELDDLGVALEAPEAFGGRKGLRKRYLRVVARYRKCMTKQGIRHTRGRDRRCDRRYRIMLKRWQKMNRKGHDTSGLPSPQQVRREFTSAPVASEPGGYGPAYYTSPASYTTAAPSYRRRRPRGQRRRRAMRAWRRLPPQRRRRIVRRVRRRRAAPRTMYRRPVVTRTVSAPRTMYRRPVVTRTVSAPRPVVAPAPVATPTGAPKPWWMRGDLFGALAPEGYELKPKLGSAMWAHPFQTALVLGGAFAVGAAVGSERTLGFFQDIGDRVRSIGG